MEKKEITYHDAEHLGIAVDTDRGLLVPVIHDAGDLNLGGLARKIADLAERTRTNKVSPDELGGGTFTLTNTGSRGALFDTPIINQPQVGILGTGAVVKRAVVVDDPDLGETIAVRSMVYLALSYDHRIVDGADAARFLVTMKERLEAGAFEKALGLLATMRIVLAGASGLIGAALKAELRADGHQVDVARPARDVRARHRQLGPGAGRVDPDFLAGADAVVCLSGRRRRRPPLDRRRTRSRSCSSRVDSVGTLARRSLTAEHGGPRTFVVASAVGYYGDTGDEVVREDHPSGDSFLAGVCRQWEAAADPAREAGVRVVHLRTGLVLAAEAALIKRLKPIAQLGGGRQARQRQAVLAVDLARRRGRGDPVRASNTTVVGPGEPDRTGAGAQCRVHGDVRAGRCTGRRSCRRPASRSRPCSASSPRTSSPGRTPFRRRCIDAGFEFRHQDVESALRWALER